jgi:hypothetical protein
MKNIKEWLTYNPNNGKLYWIRNAGGRIKAGDRAGFRHKQTGYRYVRWNGKQHQEANIIWFWMTGSWPKLGYEIDHKNRIPDDNRWDNLREVTKSAQNENRKVSRRKCKLPSNIHPVCGSTRTFRVQKTVNKKQIHIGCFPSVEEALIALERFESEK